MVELFENNDFICGDLFFKMLDESYSSLVYNYFKKNYNFFINSMPFIPLELFTEELFHEILFNERMSLLDFRNFHFFVFHKDDIYFNKILGDIAIFNINNFPLYDCSIGYKVDLDSINKGLATKFVDAIIEYCFEILDLHRIEAFTLPDNFASQKVLLKNGFIQEGITRKYLKIKNNWEDH